MYSLLLVDDEELVRNSMTKIIDWESLGFTRVYQAEDGLEALELCKKHKMDLVLTDIVMPHMDGLELSAELNKTYPGTYVVILTGHEDFEYAKKSVDLGINNYILKPVGASTLFVKMKEICKKLKIESTQKEYISNMRSQLHQSRPVLREKFLYTLVCTQYGKSQDYTNKIEKLELPLKASSYAVGIVEVDLSSINKGDTELYLFTAKNISVGCLGEKHCVFDDNNNHVIIVFNLDEFKEDAHFIIYNTLSVIQKAIYANTKVNTTCAMGSFVDALGDLHSSYSEANTAIDCHYSLGENRVYDIKDLDYIEKSFYYPFDEMKGLIYSVKFLKENDIKVAMDEIHSKLFRYKNLSSSNIKLVIIEIITYLLKEISIIKEAPNNLWDEGFSLYNQLEHIRAHDEMLKHLLNFAIKVSKELNKLQANSGHIIVENAKKFILESYSDESISLTSAAEYTGVSTGYLSALFKKETGTNFVEHLTKVRMEKAMNLLKTTDKRTYEVAYETGFSNPHYFSISFKKYSGMSPSDFRTIR